MKEGKMTTEAFVDIADFLNYKRTSLAEAITARQYEHYPELAQRYGEGSRARCAEDTAFHLSYLSTAIATDHPVIFIDYINWAKTLFLSYQLRLEDLANSLHCMRDVLCEQLPGEAAPIITSYIDASLQTFEREHEHFQSDSFIQPGQPHARLAQRYLNALLNHDRRSASQHIAEALAQGIGVKDLYLHVFQACQFEIGRLWHLRKVSIPQEHFCTAVTQSLIAQMYPAIFAAPRRGRTAVVACVGGELHELGARMVADFLELDGWDTLYLGANTPSAGIAQTVAQHNANLLCISVTMSFHVPLVAETIRLVRAQHAAQHVPILVGGYPFRLAPDLWHTVGADGFAPDAEAAVALANHLLVQ
jgi:methanogenic corrinoid protein MtbC1